jgi:hypothetical protein
MEPGSIVEGLDVGEDIKLGLGTGQLRWWLSRIRYTARMGKSVRPKRRIGKTAKRGRSDLIRRLLEESRLSPEVKADIDGSLIHKYQD